MSTVTLSKPHCAITSAEKPDGIASQAFTTALPEAHTFLTLLVVMDRVSSVVSFAKEWSGRPPAGCSVRRRDFACGAHYRRPGIVRQGRYLPRRSAFSARYR